MIIKDRRQLRPFQKTDLQKCPQESRKEKLSSYFNPFKF